MTTAGIFCATDGCEKRAMRSVGDARFCMFHPYAEPPEFDEKGRLIGKPTVLKSVTKSRDHTYRTPKEVPPHLLRTCCSTPTLEAHHPSCPHLTLSEELDVLEPIGTPAKAGGSWMDDATTRLMDALSPDPIGTPEEVAAIEAGDLLALRPAVLADLVQEVTASRTAGPSLVAVTPRVAHLGQQMEELLSEADVRTAFNALPDDPERLVALYREHLTTYAATHGITLTTTEVVHIPPPHVEAAVTALEEQLERMLDEVATVRALVRDLRIAYATPAPVLADPEPPVKPGRRRHNITPEGRERMRESGRRLAEQNRAKRAAAQGVLS